jgi:hypothetical protein
MQPFNFLAGLQQAPARAPIEVSYKKPGKFVNTLGRILDAVATAGGAAPGYKTNVLGAQKQAEADAVRTAAQRLAANPDDQEAFTFLAARDPKGAVEFRDSLRPKPAKVGGGLPAQIQIARALADPNTPPLEREWLERQINPAVYQKDAAGNLIATPKLGVPGGQPRGIRNNNAGNLKDGPFARSQPGYKGADAGGFAVFENPEAGTRAQVNLLLKRYFGQGLNTPAAIVNTYAPPGPENSSASVANYTNFIARRLGIGPNDPIPPGRAVELAAAMQEFENGVGAASGGPGARVVAANPGFRPATQNGITGQVGPDGRFYPNPAPPKGATGKQDRRAGDPARVVQLAAEARRILQESARGGYVQKALDFAGRVAGESTESSRAAAQLSQLAASMILNMPRLEGPQSDKDVALYKEQAARVGDTELPVDDRLAALNIMIATLDKYGLANPAAPPPPAVGATVKGYTFLGGDPSNPPSWRKASR